MIFQLLWWESAWNSESIWFLIYHLMSFVRQSETSRMIFFDSFRVSPLSVDVPRAFSLSFAATKLVFLQLLCAVELESWATQHWISSVYHETNATLKTVEDDDNELKRRRRSVTLFRSTRSVGLEFRVHFSLKILWSVNFSVRALKFFDFFAQVKLIKN